MITYYELRTRQQKEVNALPVGVAFSDKQFAEMMAKWGLTENDTDKIVSVGAGCFMRKSDKQMFYDMCDRHDKELDEAIAGDPTGDGFIYQMFDFELGNHEYAYTCDLEDTLNALGLTEADIEADERFKHGLALAIEHQISTAI